MLIRHSVEPGTCGASAEVTVDAVATRARLATLTERIGRDGVTADPTSLLLVAHTARDLGISPVLVSVLVDDAEPDVVRERAFGRVSALLDARLDAAHVEAVHAPVMLPATC